MNIKSTQHTRQDVLAATPSAREIFTKLENFSHRYQVTTGDLLPNFVPPELALSPMLIVCSKRISDAWCQRPLRGHPIPTMNWLTGIGRRTNWTWLGDDLCIAFDGVVALELLCDAYEAERPLLIAWVTTNLVTIDEVWADQDYLDSMSRALTDAWHPISAQRNLSFGVPSDQLPPLLSAEEERYVSEDGSLVYVARQERNLTTIWTD